MAKLKVINQGCNIMCGFKSKLPSPVKRFLVSIEACTGELSLMHAIVVG